MSLGRGRGRGRGVDNTPAWMKEMQRNKEPSSSSSNNMTNTEAVKVVPVGRGRGVDNTPAWMKERDRQVVTNGSASGSISTSNIDRVTVAGNGDGGGNNGGEPSSSSRSDRDRGGYDRGDSRGGGGGTYRGSRGGASSSSNRRRAPSQPQRFVNAPNTMPARHVTRRNATREEWEWNEDRRRRRLDRNRDPASLKFDLQPTPEDAAIELQAKAAYAMKAAGTINPSFLAPTQLEAQISGAVSPQTRHARRLYVGNVPDEISEDEVNAFFLECVERCTGRDYHGPGSQDPIISVYINRERRFAFVEFRTIEMCTSCLSLDGINLAGRGIVKIKRPNDFNPSLLTPDPAGMPGFDSSKLGIVSSTVSDSPNKIFLGGLPYHLTDAQVLELLNAFGRVKAFHLVRDIGSPTSKGYGFVEYSDPNVTDIAVMGLEGMDMGGGKTLTARRASSNEDPGVSTGMDPYNAYGAAVSAIPSMSNIAVGSVDVEALLNAAMGGSVPAPAPVAPVPPIAQQPPQATDAYHAHSVSAAVDVALSQQPYGGGSAYYQQAAPEQSFGSNSQQPTCILVLHNMVMDEDLSSNEGYTDLFDEVKGECEKFGRLVSMKIPRPQDGYVPTAVKKIFLEYVSPSDACNAERELGGRAFGPNVVHCSYFDETSYKSGKLN